MTSRKKREPAVRFWEKVSIGENCWEWAAALKENGYGKFGVGYKNGYAHRFAWQFANGEIPEGMMVLHKCDNRKCVRPAHLFLGTALDNMRDMGSKGRGVKPPHVYGERHGCTKISTSRVLEIRELSKSMTGVAIAKMFGIPQPTVSDIIRGASRVNG